MRTTRQMPVDKLLNLERRLARLEARLDTQAKSDELRRAALEKFKAGTPMRTVEVAIVLGIKVHSVHQQVYRGKLVERFEGGRFHPADVKAYMEREAS